MPESKHFFEGYSRSRDMLATLAQQITSATITRPWTLKSSGYITSTNATFNGKPHICLRRETDSGEAVNLLFIDTWNSATNNLFGNVVVYSFWHDGCDVANDKYMHGTYSNNAYSVPMQYHNSQVADTDIQPQFGWYWMWVDEDGIALTMFGNTGAAGTATPSWRFGFWGTATPYATNFNKDFCWFNSWENYGITWTSSMRDFLYPNTAPHTWRDHDNRVRTISIMPNNEAGRNPNPLNGLFTASRPALTQSAEPANSTREQVQTHWYGNGHFLFCQPGATLYRGDIVTIDSQGCDYIFQSLNANEFHRNILIKRMESAADLTAIGTTNNVTLTWKNPKRCYGVKILRKLNSQPINQTDGELIAELNINSGLLLGAAQTSTDTSANAGNTYHYRAFTYDSNGTYSAPITSASAMLTL